MNTFQYFKHLLATSCLASPLMTIRRQFLISRNLTHPELGILREEAKWMVALLASLIQRDFNCLDIGGHIGSVSYLLRRHAPEGELTIIEASPHKAGWLRKRFPDCTVVEVAVSDSAGEVSFFENRTNPGYSSLSNRGSRGSTREIRVTCARLDDLISEDRIVDLIKIDVEGHEFQALSGGIGLLRRCRPIILFEAGASSDRDVEDAGSQNVFRLLTETLDYDIYAVFDLFFGRKPIDLGTFNRYRTYPFLAFNYFALPRLEASLSD